MKKRTASAALAILMSGFPFSAIPISGAVIEGINYPEEYSSGKFRLTLRGYSLLRYMYVVKAYTGGFYLQEGVPSARALDNVPRILELHYFQKISAQDFANATTEMVKKNLSPQQFEKIRISLERLNALYRDVRPGDSYRASYMPGRGTELSLNGRSLGVVNGSLLSYAFFSIWIGKNPIDRTFRNRLLGR